MYDTTGCMNPFAIINPIKKEVLMAYQEIDYPTDKTKFYDLLRDQVSVYTSDSPDPIAALANASAVLAAALTQINWVGFYRVQRDQLILGPFQGKPAVMQIGRGQGVCGAAWSEKRAQVVKDVHCFVGHIACDCSSVSELVVPVFGQDQEVVGVIDIDSPVPGRFDDADAAGLMEVAGLIAPYFEELQQR